MGIKKYLNERSVSTVAFWISPQGEITSSQQSHIDIIIKYPEKFGFTFDKIKEIYARFNEPVGHEGKAREEIIKLVLRKKFIRIRKYPKKFWSVNIFHLSLLNRNYLVDWANKLTTSGIDGYKENDLYFPVIITDLGRGREETTIGELAKGNLLEGEELQYFITEKHVSEWEDYKMPGIKDFLMNEEVTQAEWDDFKKTVDNYDWYHAMSDDVRVARKGRAQQDKIYGMLGKLKGDDFDKARFYFLDSMHKQNIPMTPEAEKEYKKLKQKIK